MVEGNLLRIDPMQRDSRVLAGTAVQPAAAGVRQAACGDGYVPLDSASLHDLLSPLNQVCAMADLILKKYRGTLDSEAEVLFGFIQGSAKRLQNLLSGLRTYTQAVGSGSQFRRCDANSLLAAALAVVRPAIDLSGALVTHGPLPELYCDPPQISYTFASLIDNSIKFRGQSRPEIHVSAKTEGDTWVYEFRDNGIGIDPRHRESIFGVFKRIHNDAYPGAGVGLAIAKKIIEGHGGRIWVESALEQGATFFLAFPKAESADRNPKAA
jgi:light-regulated signal transduction histidine kinase (bacteriophytochrome)